MIWISRARVAHVRFLQFINNIIKDVNGSTEDQDLNPLNYFAYEPNLYLTETPILQKSILYHVKYIINTHIYIYAYMYFTLLLIYIL